MMVHGATTVRKKSQPDFKQSILIFFQLNHIRRESYEHSVNLDLRSRIEREIYTIPFLRYK